MPAESFIYLSVEDLGAAMAYLESVPADSESPPEADLTQSRHPSGWTEAQFLVFMHSGVTPDGRQLDPFSIPWESFGKFSDEELRGLRIYLQTLLTL